MNNIILYISNKQKKSTIINRYSTNWTQLHGSYYNGVYHIFP